MNLEVQRGPKPPADDQAASTQPDEPILSQVADNKPQLVDHALELAGSGWKVFPCRNTGPAAKSPMTRNGHLDATMDPDVIKAWWQRWPYAMIGAAVPTRS